MSLCFSFPATAGALGKRSYAAGYASAGDSDSALLPIPDKRKKRGARCGADTDTDTDAEAASVAAVAATIRGGADGGDDARSEETKM